VELTVSSPLIHNCQKTPERTVWLERLPEAVAELARRWSLTLGTQFEGEDVSCSWVASVTRQDGTPAVLKLGMPHMEGEQEIDGLRFWDGDPTVRLLEADEDLGAMLLEFERSGNRGSSSIRNHSPGILPMTQRSTCSTVS
jgi:streptomycin 6-kinase